MWQPLFCDSSCHCLAVCGEEWQERPWKGGSQGAAEWAHRGGQGGVHTGQGGPLGVYH